MKKLPKVWFVNVKDNHPLLSKFKNWFNESVGIKHDFSLNYYGMKDESYDCYNTTDSLISLEYWHDYIFGLVPNEQFEKGEEVLVRDNDWNEWDYCSTATFIAEYKGKYVVEWESGVDTFDQCKKKPSELDVKIEELKKLAEEKGVKLTVICEDV